jgi:hypothetical protein
MTNCDICGKDVDNLDQHKEQIHEALSSLNYAKEGEEYKCKDCGRTFDNPASQAEHPHNEEEWSKGYEEDLYAGGDGSDWQKDYPVNQVDSGYGSESKSTESDKSEFMDYFRPPDGGNEDGDKATCDLCDKQFDAFDDNAMINHLDYQHQIKISGESQTKEEREDEQMAFDALEEQGQSGNPYNIFQKKSKEGNAYNDYMTNKDKYEKGVWNSEQEARSAGATDPVVDEGTGRWYYNNQAWQLANDMTADEIEWDQIDLMNESKKRSHEMARVSFPLWRMKTVNGYWDNGLYEQSGDVMFDDKKLADAMISTKDFKTTKGFPEQERFTRGYVINVDGQSYDVVATPEVESAIRGVESRKANEDLFWSPDSATEEDESTAEFIMQKASSIWDSHGWQSGGQVVDSVYEPELKQAVSSRKITQNVIDILENENFHTEVGILDRIKVAEAKIGGFDDDRINISVMGDDGKFTSKDNLDEEDEEAEEGWDSLTYNNKVLRFESIGFTQSDALKMGELTWYNLSGEVRKAIEVDNEEKEEHRQSVQDAYNDEGAGEDADQPDTEINKLDDIDYDIIGESVTARTKYECEWCNSGFRSNESLMTHYNDTHAKINRFGGCSFCGENITQNGMIHHLAYEHSFVAEGDLADQDTKDVAQKRGKGDIDYLNQRDDIEDNTGSDDNVNRNTEFEWQKGQETAEDGIPNSTYDHFTQSDDGAYDDGLTCDLCNQEFDEKEFGIEDAQKHLRDVHSMDSTYESKLSKKKLSEANIERGDGSMTIDGKTIIKIWESMSGWYWYATEDQGSYTGVGADGEDVQAHAYYGYVQGFENEWGTWDSNELERAGVWTVPKSNWGWTGKESFAKEEIDYSEGEKICNQCGLQKWQHQLDSSTHSFVGESRASEAKDYWGGDDGDEFLCGKCKGTGNDGDCDKCGGDGLGNQAGETFGRPTKYIEGPVNNADDDLFFDKDGGSILTRKEWGGDLDEPFRNFEQVGNKNNPDDWGVEGSVTSYDNDLDFFDAMFSGQKGYKGKDSIKDIFDDKKDKKKSKEVDGNYIFQGQKIGRVTDLKPKEWFGKVALDAMPEFAEYGTLDPSATVEGDDGQTYTDPHGGADGSRGTLLEVRKHYLYARENELDLCSKCQDGMKCDNLMAHAGKYWNTTNNWHTNGKEAPNANESMRDNIWEYLVDSSRMQFLEEWQGEMNIPFMITTGAMEMPNSVQEVADAIGVDFNRASELIGKWAFDNNITDRIYESRANETPEPYKDPSEKLEYDPNWYDFDDEGYNSKGYNKDGFDKDGKDEYGNYLGEAYTREVKIPQGELWSYGEKVGSIREYNSKQHEGYVTLDGIGIEEFGAMGSEYEVRVNGERIPNKWDGKHDYNKDLFGEKHD